MADKNQLEPLDVTEQETIAHALMGMIYEAPMLQQFHLTNRFEDMGSNTVGLFPTQGAVYLRQYVSGTFVAQYPFFVRLRVRPANDKRKLEYEAVLDLLGAWMERREITMGGKRYQLEAWPKLTGNRTITDIQRTSGAFLADAAEDGTMDYQIYLTLQYSCRKG